MSGIAIIGSAIASALLGKVFGKVIDSKEPEAADKKTFQQALDQSTANAKADGMCQAMPNGAYPVSSAVEVSSNDNKAESAPAFPSLSNLLDSLFNQTRTGKSGVKDAGFSRDELAMMLSNTGESDFQRTFQLQSAIDNFGAVDKDKSGKVSDSELKDYERLTSFSGMAPINTALAPAASSHSPSAPDAPAKAGAAPVAGVNPHQSNSAYSASTDDPLAKAVGQLKAAYQLDPQPPASSSSISKAV